MHESDMKQKYQKNYDTETIDTCTQGVFIILPADFEDHQLRNTTLHHTSYIYVWIAILWGLGFCRLANLHTGQALV